jgi:hypothetical protein
LGPTLNRGSDGACTTCKKAEGDHYNHPDGNKQFYVFNRGSNGNCTRCNKAEGDHHISFLASTATSTAVITWEIFHKRAANHYSSRFEAAKQADARKREQQQCCICYDVLPVSAGLGCESSAGHSSVPLVLRVRYRGFWRQYRRQNLWCDTERKEAASCVCSRVVKHRTPSQRLHAFYLMRSSGEYCAAQDAVMEQRLFDELQQCFQGQLEAARREFENANNVARAEQGAAATAEFMRRQSPTAVQCPRCHAGPVIPDNCYELQAHHGESSSSGRGRISNACPGCGFFSRERKDWVRWMVNSSKCN